MPKPAPTPALTPAATQAADHAKLDKTFALPATPELVFEALTDAAALRVWFAEHASVERRVGGLYAFHGIHTPGNPGPGAQRLTRYEPARLLAFSWLWDRFNSEVTLTLNDGDRPGTTTLRVVHEGRGLIYDTCEYTEFALLDFWRLSIGNLRAYLTTGKAALRPRFENRGEELRFAIEINAPASIVYAALTDPAKMDRWISTAAKVALESGGTYTYGWAFGNPPEHCGPTRLLQLVPGKLLEHDWHHQAEPITRVRWQIEELGPERCRVTLTHQRPPEDDTTRKGYIGGWGAFMHMLKWFNEDPEGGDLRPHA